MTQSDLRTLAQQGNPNAIALWLNRTLQPRGVTAKVLVRADLLKVLLIADHPEGGTASHRPLEQQAFVELVQQQIRDLDLPTFQRVKVYCQYRENDRPAWIAEFSLAPIVSESKALVPISAAAEELDSASPRESQPSRRGILFDVLLPYREVFRPEIYRNAIVRLLLFLGLLPLGINLLAEQVSLAQAAWLTGTYYAIVWGLLLYHLIKPKSVSWGTAIGCVLFTVFISIPLLLLVQRVPPFSVLYIATGQGLLGRLIGFVLGVGVLEEICKAIPILLLMLRARQQNLHATTFYGAMSGLGFAVAESGAYSVQYAIGLTRGQIDLGVYLATNTIRFVSLPLFHAVLAGIMGYFIGLAARYPRRRITLLFLGLAIAAVLHGLYNAFSDGLPGLGIIGFSILLFVAYLDRSPKIVQYMEETEQARPHRSTR